MKKEVIVSLAALLMVACAPKPATVVEHQFVYDDCGVVQRIDTTEKNVYLVFTGHFSENDNGYFENFDGIEPVLNTLKDKGVKGSFFPTGACFRQAKYVEPIKRIIAEGHYLSHHSYNHLLLCPEDGSKDTVNLCDEDSIRGDMAQMEALMAEYGLQKEQYTWMIPPYEHYNAFSAKVLQDCGYKLLNPSGETLFTGNDWAGLDSKSYYTGDSLLQRLWEVEAEQGLNGAIILVHAMYYPNRNDEDRMFTRLPEIIDHLRELGYGFKCVNEL